MSTITKALCLSAATACATSGVLRCQHLRVVDSFTRLAAAYDAARGRIVTLGFASETCELEGAVFRHLPVPRLSHWPGVLVRTPDGRSLMHVAYDGVQTTTTVFDGVAWQPIAGNSPPMRASFALACDAARARVVLFGGIGGGLAMLGDTWTFDGASWTQRQPTNAPSARMGASAAYDAARARVVLFGGKDLFGGFGDTWQWNGTDWSAASPPNAPSARAWPGLAYDAVRSRTVLFGGSVDAAVFGDTWEYDGVDWHSMPSPSPVPNPRSQPQLVFDPTRGETVMLGGSDAGFLTDAWTWNGVRWLAIPVAQSSAPRTGMTFADPAGTGLIVVDHDPTPTTWRWDASGWTRLVNAAPPQRSSPAMCVDLTRPLMFGGVDQVTSTLLGDLWAFDGTNWSLLAIGGPSPRAAATMAYDPSSANVVLYGGQDLNHVVSGDTWTFDGVAWTQRQPAITPLPRAGAVSTYDFGRQRVVLFGGYGPPIGTLDDTWEWDGANWSPVTSVTAPQTIGQLSMEFDLARGRTVLVDSRGGASGLSAWSLEASGWAPVAVTQPATVNYISGGKSAHGFPYLNGLLLADQHLIYSLSARQAEVERYGVACTATAPKLMANSWPRLGTTDFAVEVIDGPASSFVALVGAVQSASLPLGGCTLLVQPGQLAVLLGTSSAGFVRSPLPVPATYALQGVELFFQAAALEAAAPSGFTLSRGLRLRVGH